MERTYKASSASTESREEKIIMTTEKIRVGIIGASMRSGWGRDAHIPALSALPEFEITAVSTSRQETADETAKHFGIPHAFADPYKMAQHPDVDVVAICVRVPSHHQLGMAALSAGKHLYCEWPLAATTEQAGQMRDLAVLKGGFANGTGFLFEIHGTEGDLAIVPADPRQATYIQVSDFTVRGAQAGKPLADLSIPESYRWVPPAVPAGLPFNVAQLYMRMAEGIREGKSVSPDFDLAVKRHQLLDAIQKASDTGIRQIL